MSRDNSAKITRRMALFWDIDVASVINRAPTFRGLVMSSFSLVEMPQKNVIPTYTAVKISIYNTTVKSKFELTTVNTVCEAGDIDRAGEKRDFCLQWILKGRY
jgi:hypothetical protein